MNKGESGILAVYMDDIRVGVGSFFRNRDDVLNGTMLIDREALVWDYSPLTKVHTSYFSFKEENTEKLIGYYLYTSGTIDIGPMSGNACCTGVTFRKSMVDVKQPESTFKYVGMGHE